MTNFLEQLAAEYYGHKGYFVKTNIRFGLRKQGGYAGEMDVVAYHPDTLSLVHIETSMDADSWEQRKKRFRKKFENADKHYRELFKFDFETIEQIAILGFNNPPREFFNIAKTQSIPQFIKQVAKYLSQYHPLRQAVPEKYPHLRAMQFTIHWGGKGHTKVRHADTHSPEEIFAAKAHRKA